LPEWPDWSGKACAIIASGPSVKKADVELLKGRLRVLAIKANATIFAPWADVVYGCDYPWWRSVRGLPEFEGLKLSFEPRDLAGQGVQKIDIQRDHDNIVLEPIGTTGNGRNSGFQALNLAIQFGANRILLLGYDCHDRGGVHHYGRNTAMGMSNPGLDNFNRWRWAFDNAAPKIAALGIDVVNTSPNSEIKAFRKQGVAETLVEWGLA
jgi:hypothetical protein